mgnify:CR=1 FL=1
MTATQTLLFRVNGDPKGKARPRFTKKGHTYTLSETKRYEQAIKDAALQAAMVQGWIKSDAPLVLHIGAWFEVPKSWSKKKRQQAEAGNLYPATKPDADNIAKVVCDALNDIAYNDDKQIVQCVIRKRYCRSSDDYPHITVFIERMLPWDEMKEKALAKEAA